MMHKYFIWTTFVTEKALYKIYRGASAPPACVVGAHGIVGKAMSE